MKKFGLLLVLVIFCCLLSVNPAFADEAGVIWDKLAGKASKVGVGLQQSGFLIGGIGLIFFSFMAIFNKISWKTLAYIMLSCFVLSAMVGLVNYFSETDKNKANSSVYTYFNGPDGNVTFQGGISPAGGTKPGGK